MRHLKIAVLSLVVLTLILTGVSWAKSFKHNKGSSNHWQWKSSQAVEGSPDIVHTIWEMERPPYGPHDKIALHQFKKSQNKGFGPKKNNKKVLFHLPGTYDTAWKGITEPEYENHIFFAANGYDVYSMDYRVSYLPNNLDRDGIDSTSAIDTSSTSEWTYDCFREDIKICVKTAKKLSGAKKIFMSGFSRRSQSKSDSKP